MCAALFGRKQEVLPGAPPVTPRVDTDTSLPATKQLEVEKPQAVAYGGDKKTKDLLAAAVKQGPAALRIPLNAASGASGSGGLNV